MIPIFLSGTLYFAIFSAMILTVRRVSPSAVLLATVYLFVLLSLASFNLERDLLEQKFASEFSFERFQGIRTFFNGNFLFQAWVNAPAFALTGAWEAAIGVNVAIFAAMILLMERLRFTYLLIFLAPAILHISLFALRDVVMTACLFLFCQVALRPHRPRMLWSALLLGALIMQRPELVAMIGITAVAIYFRDFTTVQKLAVVGVFSIFTLVFLPYLPVVLGLPPATSLASLPDTLLRFAEARADRWTGTDGGSTAILGGQLTSLPLLPRYAVQVLAFFVMPLPMDFQGFTAPVFLADSFVFIGLLVVFWRVADRRHKIFLVVYILANAFFMANYGNLFRIRMPCFIIIYSGLLSYYWEQERNRWMGAAPASTNLSDQRQQVPPVTGL